MDVRHVDTTRLPGPRRGGGGGGGHTFCSCLNGVTAREGGRIVRFYPRATAPSPFKDDLKGGEVAN